MIKFNTFITTPTPYNLPPTEPSLLCVNKIKIKHDLHNGQKWVVALFHAQPLTTLVTTQGSLQ
jgi:hypothetical protein